MEQQKHYNKGLFTGSFDLIHVGHIRAIQNAAKQCDELVVAVSTDEVIRGYKTHNPAVPFEDRLAMVAAIKGVTLAVVQDDLFAKAEMCKEFGIDVLFSSAEYQRSFYEDLSKMTPKQIAGVERWEQFEQEVGELGVDVVYLPRTQAVSSSIIKENVVSMCGAQQPQGVMLYSEGECCNEAVFSL